MESKGNINARGAEKKEIHSYTEGLMPKKHFAPYILHNINKCVINSQAPSEGAAAAVNDFE